MAQKPILPIALAAGVVVTSGLHVAQATNPALIVRLARWPALEAIMSGLFVGVDESARVVLQELKDKRTEKAVIGGTCDVIFNAMGGDIPTREELARSYGVNFITKRIPDSELLEVADELDELRQDEINGTLGPHDVRLAWMSLRYCP
jgi:hypothetical protein